MGKHLATKASGHLKNIRLGYYINKTAPNRY